MSMILTYSLDIFPKDDSRIVNIEVDSIEHAKQILDEKHKLNPLSVWNIHVYNTETKQYIALKHFSMNVS